MQSNRGGETTVNNLVSKARYNFLADVGNVFGLDHNAASAKIKAVRFQQVYDAILNESSSMDEASLNKKFSEIFKLISSFTDIKPRKKEMLEYVCKVCHELTLIEYCLKSLAEPNLDPITIREKLSQCQRLIDGKRVAISTPEDIQHEYFEPVVSNLKQLVSTGDFNHEISRMNGLCDSLAGELNNFENLILGVDSNMLTQSTTLDSDMSMLLASRSNLIKNMNSSAASYSRVKEEFDAYQRGKNAWVRKATIYNLGLLQYKNDLLTLHERIRQLSSELTDFEIRYSAYIQTKIKSNSFNNELKKTREEYVNSLNNTINKMSDAISGLERIEKFLSTSGDIQKSDKLLDLLGSVSQDELSQLSVSAYAFCLIQTSSVGDSEWHVLAKSITENLNTVISKLSDYRSMITPVNTQSNFMGSQAVVSSISNKRSEIEAVIKQLENAISSGLMSHEVEKYVIQCAMPDCGVLEKSISDLSTNLYRLAKEEAMPSIILTLPKDKNTDQFNDSSRSEQDLISRFDKLKQKDKIKTFFNRHNIFDKAVGLGALGGLAGFVLGVGSAVPTFGLGLLALPLLTAVGFAAGFTVGFVGAVFGGLITDVVSGNKISKQPDGQQIFPAISPVIEPRERPSPSATVPIPQVSHMPTVNPGRPSTFGVFANASSPQNFPAPGIGAPQCDPAKSPTQGKKG